MKIISKRLLKLERVLASPVTDVGWGGMAHTRDEILRLAAATWSESFVAELKRQLDELGPLWLWLEGVRSYLKGHGFVQTNDESLAETIARALGIGSQDLVACIAQGRIGSVLLDSFREPGETTDIRINGPL